jgi:hypothetical protein
MGFPEGSGVEFRVLSYSSQSEYRVNKQQQQPATLRHSLPLSATLRHSPLRSRPPEADKIPGFILYKA